MSNLCKRFAAGVFLLAVISTAKSSSLTSGDPRDIVRTLKVLRSPEYSAAVPAILPLLQNENANVVRDACRTLAVIATKDAIPSIEPLLHDSRAAVRKDAQDAVDNLRAGRHPDYSLHPTQRPAVLASFDPPDIVRTLKLLRSPEFSAAVPAIIPLLHHQSANVVRDACRTLAVIGTKEIIPSIELLLDDKRENVRKDAHDAIEQLRRNS
ncbi:MAG TPA: HEAT repeat domain-containing protein [Verrucomicrobiae bacterium]|jgi:HEAT repeat protein